jgi:hypothetical protein
MELTLCEQIIFSTAITPLGIYSAIDTIIAGVSHSSLPCF